VLLKSAIQPNLVQTLENNPAFIHGGPFANIAHGCNSVTATKTALKLVDYVVTEAGFGADLGAEKFFDIKCRKAGLKPSACVIVATVRALKMNGGVAKGELGKEDAAAVKKGVVNLLRHIENVRQFGVPAVVAINHFVTDTDAEIAVIREAVAKAGTEAIVCTHWANGGAGTEELAGKVVEIVESGAAQFAPLYPAEMSLFEKINTIATRIYRADEAIADQSVRNQLKAWEGLEAFDRPFLTAFSDKDPVTGGGNRIFEAKVPGAKGQPHTTIEGGGHFLQEDKGPELAKVVVDFIRST